LLKLCDSPVRAKPLCKGGHSLLTLRVLVTQSTFTHVGELDRSLGARVHEPVAADRVELRSCDNLCKLLHVRWLDVDNVEALVLDVEVPEVNPQIVATDERLSITVNRYAIDVICVRVGIRLPRYCGDYGIMVCESRELQIRGTAELCVWVPDRTTATSNPTSGRQLV
jgi:hypothetical protein